MGYMRSVGIWGSTSDSSDIPPELGGDISELEIFIEEGRVEDVIEVRLGFRVIGSSVIRGGWSDARRDREWFR